MKRNVNEKYINNYNPVILAMWQANKDIQPIGSVLYCNRPIQLENLCLHQFASCWKVKAKKIYNYDDENEDENLDEEIELESFKLLNSQILICKRKNHAIINT